MSYWDMESRATQTAWQRSEILRDRYERTISGRLTPEEKAEDEEKAREQRVREADTVEENTRDSNERTFYRDRRYQVDEIDNIVGGTLIVSAVIAVLYFGVTGLVLAYKHFFT